MIGFLLDSVMEIIPEFIFFGILNSLFEWLKFLLFNLSFDQLCVISCNKLTFIKIIL